MAFTSGVEEHLPNRPAAIALAKLRGGRYIALPRTRVEGFRWNLDQHKRVAAAIAAMLEERPRAAVTDTSRLPRPASRAALAGGCCREQATADTG